MGRELRRVTPDWDHPLDSAGRPRPLYNGSYAEAAREYEAEAAAYVQGPDMPATYAEWDGDPPKPDDYMYPGEAPDPATLTHVQMYEDTSEGTPISPVFATIEELARWLADSGASAFGYMTATYEEWLATCQRGWVPSAMVGPGGMVSGVAGAADSDGAEA